MNNTGELTTLKGSEYARKIFRQTKKFDKDPKETKIDELCRQV